MKEVLKPIMGKKGPKFSNNGRVGIEKRQNFLYQVRPLLYDIYDIENYIFLGTCRVCCQVREDRSVPILIVVKAGVPEFSEILEVANRKLST